MSPIAAGRPRARSPHLLAAAALLGAGALAVVAADDARAATPARVLLVNDWRSWQVVRHPPRAVGVAISRRGGLRVRLAPSAHPRARGVVRLTLPRGVSPVAIRLRVSFDTPGAVAFVSRGALTRRTWSRGPGRRGQRVVLTLPMRSSRTVFVGLLRRGPRGAMRSAATLTVHAYALSLPGRRVPLPTTSRTPVPGGAAAGGPVPAAGVTAVPRPSGANGTAEYSGPRVYWGARIGGSTYGADRGDAPWDRETLRRFEQGAGKGVSLLAWGQPWYDHGVPQRFAADVFDSVRRHGAIPVVDWSPWDRRYRGYHDQPDFQLRDVINGDHDPYIREWARGAARWGHPMFLRLCHEMNGDWYPWSERENGNASGEFVRAWRHVVDIFRAEGAHNVSFVWAPNEFESYAGIPVSQLYPGDAYVDWVGMSGYNWGTGQTGSRWRTFPRTFTRTYAALRALAPAKPLMIAEVASSERGGSKADWLRDALAVQLPQRFPDVKAVVYWNKADEGMDWPVESSPGARSAFAEALASPYYLGNRFSALSASPIPPP